MRLNWKPAGGSAIRWGDGMVVADVALSKDETLTMYKDKDAPEPTPEMFGFSSTPQSDFVWDRRIKPPVEAVVEPRTEVGELVEARKRMEQSIFNAATKAVQDFQRETGLTPASISIEMCRMQFFGELRPQHSVSAVKAHVEL